MLGSRRLGGADADWPGLLLDRASGARARARRASAKVRKVCVQ